MTLVDLMREPFRVNRFTADRMPSRQDLWARLRHKETLLAEAHHRVGNSLQIIASSLALDARTVQCPEAREALVRAHRRILAVAAAQQQLQLSRDSGDLEFADYLRKLVESLAASLVNDPGRISIEVRADPGRISSDIAAKLGLIVTELVINAVKHAFPGDTASGLVTVTYRAVSPCGDGWTLTVADDGVGLPANLARASVSCLGSGIVSSLTARLGARIEATAGPDGSGTSISIICEQKTLLSRIGA